MRQVLQNLILDPVKPSPRSHPRSFAKPRSEGGGEGVASIPMVDLSSSSGGRLEPLTLLLFEECQVEVAMLLLPPLVLLNG